MENKSNHQEKIKQDSKLGRKRAVQDFLGMVGLVAVITNIGFGATAYQVGLWYQTLIMNLWGIYGLPGQLNHIAIATQGGGFVMTFLAVAFVNFRMFPMVISTMGFIQQEKSLNKPLYVWLLMMHVCVSTTWIRTLSQCQDLGAEGRYTFYKTSGWIYFFLSAVSVTAGYFVVQSIPHPYTLIFLVLVPLFMFIQSVSPSQRDSMTASVLGMVFAIPAYPHMGMWAVILGGITASIVAFGLWHTVVGRAVLKKLGIYAPQQQIHNKQGGSA